MLENLRYKIGTYFLEKAAGQLEWREYEKAFRNIKRGVLVVPATKELSDFGEALRMIAADYTSTKD